MFEYKVTWVEETEVPSIYQFRTLKEAKSFHQGLIEPGHKIPNSPKVFKVERGRWEYPLSKTKKKSLSLLLFSALIGIWTAIWWYLLHQEAIIAVEEYILIGCSATLANYLLLLIWDWFKKRKFC